MESKDKNKDLVVSNSDVDVEVGTDNSGNRREPLFNEVNVNNDLCDNNDCFGLLIIIGVFLFSVGLFAGVICYYVFGIKFLVEDKDKNDNCDSGIWTFVLTCIIISGVFALYSTNSSSDSDLQKLVSILAGLVSFGIGIWGLTECLNEDCDEIKQSNLFDFAYIVSIIDIIVGGIVLLIIIFGSIKIYMEVNS
tara:strand:- start:87 stop:665 length:579 start_codon:yes stop_codon:yes gene_type:complete